MFHKWHGNTDALNDFSIVRLNLSILQPARICAIRLIERVNCTYVLYSS